MPLHMLLCGWTLVVLADPAPPVQQELARLQGTWAILSSEQDARPDPSLNDARVIIQGEQFTTRVGDKILRHGTLKIDPSHDPKTIDLVYADGPQKGQTSQGIYNLNGDSWTLVFSIPGKERPANFDHRTKIGRKFLVLKKDDQGSKGN